MHSTVAPLLSPLSQTLYLTEHHPIEEVLRACSTYSTQGIHTAVDHKPKSVWEIGNDSPSSCLVHCQMNSLSVWLLAPGTWSFHKLSHYTARIKNSFPSHVNSLASAPDCDPAFISQNESLVWISLCNMQFCLYGTIYQAPGTRYQEKLAHSFELWNIFLENEIQIVKGQSLTWNSVFYQVPLHNISNHAIISTRHHYTTFVNGPGPMILPGYHSSTQHTISYTCISFI